ncbi:MAG: 30S ribosomal protein S15 [Chloroflexi bacterium]|nr:30S ribosomal protein S15 [Chloroflexota bacterium]
MEKQAKEQLVATHQLHKKDTGSPEVQVAILTERIRELTQHLIANRKDVSSRLGLQKMVGQRRRLLRYLAREDLNRFQKIVSTLGLRAGAGRGEGR